MRIMW